MVKGKWYNNSIKWTGLSFTKEESILSPYNPEKGTMQVAYNELIKNFEKVRAYMREFYVYGFKSRNEYDGKSARSYDDERRRIESWLGEYMHFTQTAEGKNVFLSDK